MYVDIYKKSTPSFLSDTFTPQAKVLHSAINLIDDIPIRIRLPIHTSLLHNIRNLALLRDIIRPLQEMGIQTPTNMPSDVTVERPNTWIICVVLEDKVAIGTHHLDISALWVRRVNDSCSVVIAWPFGEDLHVVSVEMHRVRGGRVVVDDHADGAVTAEVLHVPFGWECEVALVGLEEDGLVVVGPEGCPVECPEETAC